MYGNWFSLNLYYIPHRLNGIFNKKKLISTVVHIFGMWGLEKLWTAFDHFQRLWHRLKAAVMRIVLFR